MASLILVNRVAALIPTSCLDEVLRRNLVSAKGKANRKQDILLVTGRHHPTINPTFIGYGGVSSGVSLNEKAA